MWFEPYSICTKFLSSLDWINILGQSVKINKLNTYTPVTIPAHIVRNAIFRLFKTYIDIETGQRCCKFSSRLDARREEVAMNDNLKKQTL